jgi:hypothetical protein
MIKDILISMTLFIGILILTMSPWVCITLLIFSDINIISCLSILMGMPIGIIIMLTVFKLENKKE